MIACSHPIRLRGSQDRIDGVTGELLARIVTAREPGGVMLVSCGDRRAGHCPSCAETYRYDAFHLVASGLRGGKGIPETVAAHPAVMVTFTAPSFGSVHTIRDRDGLCACGARHAEDDETLGTPVDPKSYRYLEQVVWNHLAPTLWKLTVQAVRRHLARELGVARHRLGDVVHVRFVKVAEFQRRGVVHYHVVIRLDGPTRTATEPPSRCTAALLERAVRAAAREARIQLPESTGLAPGRRSIRWGRQLEIVCLGADNVDRAAGYVAKYATKATEAAAGGLVLPRVRTVHDVAALDVPPHAKRLVEAAWRLGSLRGFSGARRWAHQFGYGGHTLTKSRDYSVTFAALREARAAWRVGRTNDPPAVVVRRGRLSYAGRGHVIALSQFENSGPTLDLAMGGGSAA
jgi:hypothetical protein